MNHVFVGPKLKVERAYQHILDLESRVADFAAHKSNTIVTKKDATGLDVVVFEGDEPLPALISLCVGDAAHNLRSALDQMSYDACSRRGRARTKRRRSSDAPPHRPPRPPSAK